MDDLIREMITEPRRSSLDASRRTRLVVTTLTVGLACVGVTSLTTGALFTDQKTLSSTDFTTGTVVIDPTTAVPFTFAAAGLAPGDTTYGAVSVANAGTLAQRYAISITASNPAAQVAVLTDQLNLNLYAIPAATPCDAAGVAAGTLIGTMGALPTTLTPLVGDKAPGGHPGDRTLIAGSSETLCAAVNLPIGTDNSFQNTSASFVLTFDAEQTANNA